jgi:hypothetical protein
MYLLEGDRREEPIESKGKKPIEEEKERILLGLVVDGLAMHAGLAVLGAAMGAAAVVHRSLLVLADDHAVGAVLDMVGADDTFHDEDPLCVSIAGTLR